MTDLAAKGVLRDGQFRVDLQLSDIGHSLRLHGGESACLVVDGQGKATVHREDEGGSDVLGKA